MMLTRLPIVLTTILGIGWMGAGTDLSADPPQGQVAKPPGTKAPAEPAAPTDALGIPCHPERCAHLGTLRLQHYYPFSFPAFAPDGKTLAAAGHDGKTIYSWTVDGGAPVQQFQGHQGGVEAVAFAPNGKTLASASADATIRLWDVATGRESGRLLGHSSEVRQVAFAPGGRILASSGDDDTVRLWDVASGQQLRQFPALSGAVQSRAGAVFAPDGQTLVAEGGTSKIIRLWDVATGKEVRRLDGRHQQRVGRVAFAPDGQTLASTDAGQVHLWSVSTGRNSAPIACGEMSSEANVAFRPDGKALFAESQQRLCLWDVATGKELQQFPGLGGFFVLAPDGRTLATWPNYRLRPRDVATTKERLVLGGHHNQIEFLALSPSSSVLATGSRDRTVRLWDPLPGARNCARWPDQTRGPPVPGLQARWQDPEARRGWVRPERGPFLGPNYRQATSTVRGGPGPGNLLRFRADRRNPGHDQRAEAALCRLGVCHREAA